MKNAVAGLVATILGAMVSRAIDFQLFANQTRPPEFNVENLQAFQDDRLQMPELNPEDLQALEEGRLRLPKEGLAPPRVEAAKSMWKKGTSLWNEWHGFIFTGLTVGVGLFLVLSLIKFANECQETMNAKARPKEPWEEGYVPPK